MTNHVGGTGADTDVRVVIAPDGRVQVTAPFAADGQEWTDLRTEEGRARFEQLSQAHRDLLIQGTWWTAVSW